jgi:hypothetical protein
MQNELLTIRTLIASTMADVDIFLLKDESQTNDLDKVYTIEEIRNQLHKTNDKLVEVLSKLDYDVDKPLKKEISFSLK